jgi:ribonuclease G
MAKEICISSTPHETRLAILEDDQLAEIYYERENEYTLAGSIYNGRVTRVLPGMQSAFVDVGLERDAFLYVTDFMELEDPEETDEIEKAAASGGNQPPREVRGQDKNGGRGGQKQEQRPQSAPAQKSEAKPEPKPEQQRRPAVLEAGGAIHSAPEPSFVVESTEGAEEGRDEESGDPGAKRWRGRRRRRGGRGQAGSPEGQASDGQTEGQHEAAQKPAAYIVEAEETTYEPQSESAPEIATEIQAWASPVSRTESAPARFVLPGESLTKYGGAPAASLAASASTPVAPAKPQSSYKPATLIESPIEWDGSGLMPGESLSRHRNRPAKSQEQAAEPQPAPAAHFEPSAEVHGEPRGIFSDSPLAVYEEAIATEELKLDSATETAVEEVFAHGSHVHQIEENFEEEELVQDLLIEETSEFAPEPQATAEAPAEEIHAAVEESALSVAESTEANSEPVEAEHPSAEPEPDAEASHHVDPLPPTGFRLFGLGGKKKKDEEAEPKAASVTSVSAYAPGSGLIEEEVIDEEESYAPARAHHGKNDLHDNEDFEEETLPRQMRSGDLGELLQEAHLDHRIQLNFDGDGEEGEEGATAGTQPAAGDSQQRRDR